MRIDVQALSRAKKALMIWRVFFPLTKEVKMPAYVVLTKFTDQGVRAAKDTVKRAKAAREQIEAAGGHVIGIWWLLGEYDSVLICELPDSEKAVQLLLATGMQGDVRTKTLQAFSEEEMARVVQGLP
jgi:uncharacterized protein with GYD domain